LLTRKSFKSPFCEKDGSDVGNDMKVDLYLALMGINPADTTKIDVYFKTKKIFTKLDESTREFIKEKLDSVPGRSPRSFTSHSLRIFLTF